MLTCLAAANARDELRRASHGHLDPGMHVMTKLFAMEALAGRIKELLSADR